MPKTHNRSDRAGARAHEPSCHRRGIAHDDAIGRNAQQQRKDNPHQSGARNNDNQQQHITQECQGQRAQHDLLGPELVYAP